MSRTSYESPSHRPVAAILSHIPAVLASAAILAALHPGCCPKQEPKPDGRKAESVDRACPERGKVTELLPSVTKAHLKASYWIERLQGLADPDQVLLSIEEIDRYNAALEERPNRADFSRQRLTGPVDTAQLELELKRRLDYLRELIASGRYLDRLGERLSGERSAAFKADLPSLLRELRPRLQVALGDIQIRCGPFDGALYKPDVDLTYDRNACSRIRPQELVQVLRDWPNGMLLLRTAYALGWASADVPLSPPVPAGLAKPLLTGERLRATSEARLEVEDNTPFVLARHLTVPLADGGEKVLLASTTGVHLAVPIEVMETTRRPLTRRALLQTAFEYLDEPFGWGGTRGGRDCSRFVLDLFATFGIVMPRHSGWQARTGSYVVEVKGSDTESERLRLLDEAIRCGVVLLHFPGHIMLYLGRDRKGVPMVLHSLGEYVKTCPGGAGETLFLVQRITVTGLDLGRGSSRRSFVERLTRIVVLGKKPQGPKAFTDRLQRTM